MSSAPGRFTDLSIEAMRHALDGRLEALVFDGLEERGSRESSVGEALRYGVSGAGKRIRSLFMLALRADLSDSVEEPDLVVAVALEILHSASLIHDDLPALDNDDERRGRASLHCAFDEAAAVLVGDYLVPYALRLCSEIDSLEPEQALRIVQELAKAYEAVCVGQMLDASEDTSPEHILKVHRLKTAAVFKAAATCAAISGKLSPEIFSSVVALGETFGMYFQLVDDFLDRDDGAPNYFSTLSLPEGMEALDSTWLGLENMIVSLEALSARRTLTRTREVCMIVRSQVLA